MTQGLHEQAFERGVNGHHIKLFDRPINLLNDRRCQRYANPPRQFRRVLQRAVFGQCFNNGPDVTNMDALIEQKLKHFLKNRYRHEFGNHVLNQFRCRVRHMLDELL